MVEVINKGLETSIQDYPGRIGSLNQGFPPSGPMDNWSFRLANVLVENKQDAAALECQFMGPSLKFNSNTIIAITGANMSPKLDGNLIERVYAKFQLSHGIYLTDDYQVNMSS